MATIIQPIKRELQYGSLSISPADSSNYYVGLTYAAPAITAANTRQFKFKTIKNVIQNVYLNAAVGAAAGSNENVTFQLRNVTQGTSQNIGTFQYGFTVNTQANFSYEGLSLNINTNDYFSWEFITPAWVTNPSNVFFNITAEGI